jgi:hypothetical protein
MSITQLTVTPTGEILFNDTAIANSVDGIKASAATLNSVTIDNTAGLTGMYLKLYNAPSGSVVVGATVPDEIIYGPAGSEISVSYWTEAEEQTEIFEAVIGKAFPIALSATCETSGATGATGPSSNVIATISYQ